MSPPQPEGAERRQGPGSGDGPTGGRLLRRLGSRRRQSAKIPLRAKAGLIMVVIILLMAILAPWISPHAPNGQDFSPLLPPSLKHPFGTDDLGRDVLSRVIYGSRISVIVSFIGVAVGAAAGTGLGLVAALRPGIAESGIMRLVDILLAYPGIILGIGIVSLFGSGSKQITVAVAVFNVPIFARLTHSAVQKENALDYVRAAVSLGASTRRLAWKHVLPNSLPALIPQLSLSLGGGVLIEAALSFLGFGAQPPTASWGAMLSESRQYLSNAPMFAIAPGIALAIFVVGFNLLGDAAPELLARRGVGELPLVEPDVAMGTPLRDAAVVGK